MEWSPADGAKYNGDKAITSAVVSSTAVDLGTNEADINGQEIGAFQHCWMLKSVLLPRSLTRIGHCAFYFCKSLVSIDIPSGVTSIGECAFMHCRALESAAIPEGVVNLPICLFKNCTGLRSVTLPKSLKSIGRAAFDSCSSLEGVNGGAVLEGVGEIGHDAFKQCASLKSIKLPRSLKSISERAFLRCAALEVVDLPSSLLSIEGSAFSYCESLTRVNFEGAKGLKVICEHAFAGCKSLESARLPESVENIMGWAFYECKSLSVASLPAALRSIGEEAFCGCGVDLCIGVPAAVKDVGYCAFEGCKIRLPTSLAMIKGEDVAGGPSRVPGLLNRVSEVIVSSRVNVGRLAEHVARLPDKKIDEYESEDEKDDFLCPDLTFKVIYSGSAMTCPRIEDHVHESFFSVCFTADELASLRWGWVTLRQRVDEEFSKKASSLAELLQCKSVELPKDVLYVVLPYLYGESLTKPMLRDIVVGVGKQLSSVRDGNAAPGVAPPPPPPPSAKLCGHAEGVALPCCRPPTLSLFEMAALRKQRKKELAEK